MEQNNIQAKLYEALAKAQAELKPAIKDASNPFFKSKYADLPAVWEAAQSVLSKNGLSVIQMPTGGSEAGELGLTTVLAHKDGGTLSSTFFMTPAKKNDPQAAGSCITYMRRYALAAFVGIVQEDDDANSASGKLETYTPKKKSAFSK